VLLSFLNLTKKKTKHKDKHEDKRQSTKYKQRKKCKGHNHTTTQPRPTRPAVTPLKNNSNNLIQKIKRQLPIQQKITTRTTVIPKTKTNTQKPQPKAPAPMTRRTLKRNPKAAPKT